MEDLLTLIRQFIPLSGTDQAVVVKLFKPYHVAAGTFFVQQDEVCRHIGFLTKGLCRYYTLADGVEHTYDFSPERTFVCNYESFLTQTPSTRFIEALEPTDLWRISYDDLQQLYSQVAHGQQFGRLIAEQLFVDTLRKLTAFYQETAEERYASFLRLFPALSGRIPQYIVASYVGIKPQSLSRIRAQRAGKSY